jgi:protein TonB
MNSAYKYYFVGILSSLVLHASVMSIPLSGVMENQPSEVYPAVNLFFEYRDSTTKKSETPSPRAIASGKRHWKKEIHKALESKPKKERKQDSILIKKTAEEKKTASYTTESLNKKTESNTFSEEKGETEHKETEEVPAAEAPVSVKKENKPLNTPLPDKEYRTSFGSVDGPRFLKRVIPRYPKMAKRFGIEGRVILMLTIDEKGNLIEVEVVERAGYGFDREAVKAVKESTYLPAYKNGVPVKSKALLTVRFVLKEGG